MRAARVAICAVACGFCGGASAENRPLPDLFDITGVAPADTLNVRSAPDARAEIIGELGPEATDVEVTAIQGGWGRVNQGERSGWTAMRFLSRQDETWIAGAIPPALTCFGTEPFWSLGFEGQDLVWSDLDVTTGMAAAEALGGAIPGDVRRGLVAAGDRIEIHAAISPGTCSDGMSDRAFGLTAAIIVDEGGGPRLLHGCCSIAP